jgi:isopentenyl diphosphate isomerase/L-lactate dehydrogenase-like FMN-dependent dehydrogenase
MGAESALNVDAFRGLAKKRLPRLVFDIVDGGAGDELTLRANREAFGELALRPRALVDVSERDISTTVFGQRIAMPLMLDPCGAGQMMHREGELAVARAAGRAGTIYALSTAASYQLEDVAAVATGPLWFGLYLAPTWEETTALIDRAKSAGFAALCLTVDGATNGLRERDSRNGLGPQLDFRLTPGILAQGMTRPAWSLDFLRGGVARSLRPQGPIQRRARSLAETRNQIRHLWRPVSRDDLMRVRERWDGPLVVKGILRGDDVQQLVECGVDGVIVSNHGGRQLDSVPASIQALPEVVEAAGGRVEVFVDGGIRRGTDVVKALALGAKACLIGRPYLYALAAGGQAGVERVLELFRGEIDQTLTLLGCTSVHDVDRSVVWAVGAPEVRARAAHEEAAAVR